MSEFLKTALSGLNAAQRDASETLYGPLVVIAGPGTGKTQIVACRAANILTKTDAKPENLLITTFTEAGVVSIKKRLLKFLGTDAYRITVSTIHAFANDVIRMYPEKFLRFRAMRPIEDIDQIALFEDIIEKAKYEYLSSDHDRFFYLQNIRDRIGKLKQEAVSPDAFEESIGALSFRYAEELSEIDPKLKKYATEKSRQEKHVGKLKDLCHAYREYLSQCYVRGYYDFSDMISYVGEALEADGDLRATLAERFQFVMLDEFQDMSGAQNRIIDAILSESDTPNVMAVGDDDQSIYRFQGASLENLFHFSKRYEGTKFVVLTENYRSTAEILALAEKSVSNNKERIGAYVPSITKSLRSNRDHPLKELKITAYGNPLEEKAAVLNGVRKCLSQGVDPEEIAILTRTNRETQNWAHFLAANGVGVESRASADALASESVTLALDLLEVASDASAPEEKVIRLARSGLFPLEPGDVLRINRALYKLNYSRKDRLRFLDFVSDIELLRDVGVADPESFVAFYQSIAEAAPENVRLPDDFKRIFESVGFLDFVEKRGSFSDLEDVFTLFETARDWAEREDSLTVAGFLKKIGYYRKYSLSLPTKRLSEIPGRVKVLTAHQSKGLEYEAVFLSNLSDGNWGGRKNVDQLRLPPEAILKDGSADIGASSEEEERRLFFVALTRAKSKLALSFHESDGSKLKIASEFLTELGMEIEKSTEIPDYASAIASEMKPVALFRGEMTDSEEAYVREFLQGYRLSPSDLNKFLEDPKLFLRDTIFKYPFEDNEYTVFGKCYHRALELFYLTWKKDGKESPIDTLLTDFERALKQEILTPETREKLLKKGREGLAGWYSLHAGKVEMPLELEYNFYPRNIVFEGIPMTGKIDKIERRFEGVDEVRLVDYKTGRIKSLNEMKGLTANGDAKYFRQLLFYKLLFELDSTLSPKFRPTSLSIEFVEGKDGEYRSVEMDFTDEDFEHFICEVRDSWKKISDPAFWREVLASE